LAGDPGGADHLPAWPLPLDVANQPVASRFIAHSDPIDHLNDAGGDRA